jgi:AcrR family transcriptional regulator
MSTDEEWVRAPRQARSQATLERFVEATRQLLEQQSFEAITVADIVQRAERTVGSFYARFDDKYAVLHVLVDRLHQRISDVLDAFCDPVRWDGVPLSEFVEESVRLNVQAYRRSGPLFRAALQASATDERFRRRRMETMQLCAEAQKRFILSRRTELRCSDPARASDMMFELVSATLDHELLFGRFTTTHPESDLVLVEELVSQCNHVLGLDAPVDADSPPAGVAAAAE